MLINYIISMQGVKFISVQRGKWEAWLFCENPKEGGIVWKSSGVIGLIFVQDRWLVLLCMIAMYYPIACTV